MISSTDRGSRNFVPGDSVLLRNFSGMKWKSGIVNEKSGNRHYLIKVESEIVKSHIDHLLRREETDNENVSFALKTQVLDNEETVQSEPCVISTGEDKMTNEPVVDVDVDVSLLNNKSHDTKAVPSNKESACQISSERNVPDLNVSTRPSRERKLPSYLKDYVQK